MKNVAGVLVVAAGVFFAIVGVKGTQHAALPSLFPKASSPPPIQVRPAQPGDPNSGNPITGTSGNYD